MTRKLYTLLILALTFAVPATAATASTPSPDPVHQHDDTCSSSHPDDIVDIASEAGSFRTLIAALQAADLVDTLRGDGPFTVFAPTDAAFAKLPHGTVEDLLEPRNRHQLTEILTYHVVEGRITSEDLLGASSARTVNGTRLPVGLRVGNANVVRADIEASNGVIHIIDSVLLPE